MKSYRLTGPARADVQRIWNDVADRSERQADRLVGRFNSKFRKLAEQPLLQGADDDVYGTPYRISQVGDYIIFYTPTADGVTIARVIHGAQDIGSMAPF